MVTLSFLIPAEKKLEPLKMMTEYNEQEQSFFFLFNGLSIFVGYLMP